MTTASLVRSLRAGKTAIVKAVDSQVVSVIFYVKAHANGFRVEADFASLKGWTPAVVSMVFEKGQAPLCHTLIRSEEAIVASLEEAKTFMTEFIGSTGVREFKPVSYKNWWLD